MPLIHVTDTTQAQPMCDLINPWIAARPEFYANAPPYTAETARGDIARGSVWGWQNSGGQYTGGVIAHVLREADPDTAEMLPVVFINLIAISPTITLTLNLTRTIIDAIAVAAKSRGINRVYARETPETVAVFRANKPALYAYLRANFRVLRDDEYGFIVDFKKS